jgi:hypothetical protein
VLSFEDVDRDALPIFGDKAANLDELTRAGLPVSAAFCVTTVALRGASGAPSVASVPSSRGETRAGDHGRPFTACFKEDEPSEGIRHIRRSSLLSSHSRSHVVIGSSLPQHAVLVYSDSSPNARVARQNDRVWKEGSYPSHHL